MGTRIEGIRRVFARRRFGGREALELSVYRARSSPMRTVRSRTAVSGSTRAILTLRRVRRDYFTRLRRCPCSPSKRAGSPCAAPAGRARSRGDSGTHSPKEPDVRRFGVRRSRPPRIFEEQVSEPFFILFSIQSSYIARLFEIAVVVLLFRFFALSSDSSSNSISSSSLSESSSFSSSSSSSLSMTMTGSVF